MCDNFNTSWKEPDSKNKFTISFVNILSRNCTRNNLLLEPKVMGSAMPLSIFLSSLHSALFPPGFQHYRSSQVRFWRWSNVKSVSLRLSLCHYPGRLLTFAIPFIKLTERTAAQCDVWLGFFLLMPNVRCEKDSLWVG